MKTRASAPATKGYGLRMIRRTWRRNTTAKPSRAANAAASRALDAVEFRLSGRDRVERHHRGERHGDAHDGAGDHLRGDPGRLILTFVRFTHVLAPRSPSASSGRGAYRGAGALSPDPGCEPRLRAPGVSARYPSRASSATWRPVRTAPHARDRSAAVPYASVQAHHRELDDGAHAPEPPPVDPGQEHRPHGVRDEEEQVGAVRRLDARGHLVGPHCEEQDQVEHRRDWRRSPRSHTAACGGAARLDERTCCV